MPMSTLDRVLRSKDRDMTDYVELDFSEEI